MLFIVVITIKLSIPATRRFGRPQITADHRDWYTVMEAGRCEIHI